MVGIVSEKDPKEGNVYAGTNIVADYLGIYVFIWVNFILGICALPLQL
jgi:hypothetical protein